MQAVYASPDLIRGLPFTRSYPMDEIGYVPRSARLDFDSFGRVAVIHEGVYSVLNDTTWLNIAQDEGAERVAMANVIQGRDGRAYYGARSSWGLAELSRDGRLRPVPLTPAEMPDWTRTAAFNELIATADGVYFCSWNGIVFHDYRTQQSTLYEVASATAAFAIGDRLYVSSSTGPLRYVDHEHRGLREIPGTELENAIVDAAIPLADSSALLALYDGRLFLFDGERLTPWEAQLRHGLYGRISGLHRLVDGDVAIAITGLGLFILTPDGDLIARWTIPQFQRVTDLASRESGVLWAATEDAVEKILYRSALTTFGQRLDLPLGWPIVQRWRDRTFVSSDGRLYEAITGPPGAPSKFKHLETQPPGGAWALDAAGDRMLVGSEGGIFEFIGEGDYSPICVVPRLMHLVMLSPDSCFAIGRAEIAYLQRENGRWVESVARIGGVEYPPVVHGTDHAVWIEMGGAGVARLTLENGALRLETIEHEALTGALWVNVGVVGRTVVLTGGRNKRVFFDDETGTWIDSPTLADVLNRSPYWITRVQQDDAGTIWATHDEGVVVFTPTAGDFSMDAITFDAIGDRYPRMQLLGKDEVWFSAARSLHRVEPDAERRPKPVLQPVLVSVTEQTSGSELLASSAQLHPLRLPADLNSLSFRFFAGTYNWRRSPRYEFRLSRTEAWTPVDASSSLSFRSLPAGTHTLEVRLAESEHGRATPPTSFTFQILPPWYRTTWAYLAYAIGASLAVYAILRISGQWARKRHRALEQLVHERTHQLEATMEQLNDEARNAATLAERNRLAGEIHDSLQQGLSGALLQLDATLELPQVDGAIRKRLDVVRNMVSYTRHEVQHAVWDMESPLLEGSDLSHALRQLTAFPSAGATKLDVVVTGDAVDLPMAVNHQLLRIAQEAVTNALRHAQARHICIRLSYTATQVTLAVVDDGIGFDPAHVTTDRPGHFGLRGLRSRARRVGTDLQLHSRPGAGTTVSVMVPVGALADLPAKQ